MAKKKADDGAADAKAKKKADKAAKKAAKEKKSSKADPAATNNVDTGAKPNSNDLFELGRYIERHLGGKNSNLTGVAPTPPASNAGFLDAISQFSALSEQEFANMMIGLRRKKKAEEAKVQQDPKAQFEAGRLFERFDKNQDGNIDKLEFLKMMEQLEHSDSSKHARKSPINRISGSSSSLNPDDEHDLWQRVLHPNPKQPIAVHPNLMLRLLRKKEQLVFQMRALQSRMERCRACKRAVERDTVMDTQAVLRRLSQAEAFKLSVLQNDLDMLKRDAEAVTSFVKHVSSNEPLKALHSSKVLGMGLLPTDMGPRWHYDEESSISAAAAIASSSIRPPHQSRNPYHDRLWEQQRNFAPFFDSHGRVPMYKEGTTNTVPSMPSSHHEQVDPVEFIRLYPELCDMAQRLIAKEFNTQIDVAVDDFPQEMLERREKAAAFEDVLSELEKRKENVEVMTMQLYEAKKELEEQKKEMKQQANEYVELSMQAAQSLEEASNEMDKIKKENTLYLNRIKELEEEIARRDHLENQEKVMEAYQQQQAEFEQKKSETMETNV